MRLPPSDLATLGIYLFGPRWQSALARALHCDARLVRFWVAQARPVSRNASKQIEQLVRHKHSEQMRRLRGFYVDIIGGLSGTAIRGRLMTIDLASLRLDDALRRAALSTVVAFPPPPSVGLPPGDRGSAPLTTSSAAA